MKLQPINFEVAKLLKEKDKEFIWEWVTEYSRPTQALVVKWLRDVHGLNISIVFNKNWDYIVSDFKFLKEREEHIWLGDNYNSYEQAEEATIEYVLKNLI